MAYANVKTACLCLCVSYPTEGADSWRANVYVCFWMRLCVDRLVGRARPRIRVQTNCVINESDRGVVMGPAPKLLMHADQYRQPFVLEKRGSCQWHEETMFILKRQKVSLFTSSVSPTWSFSLSLFLSSHTHTETHLRCRFQLSGGVIRAR